MSEKKPETARVSSSEAERLETLDALRASERMAAMSRAVSTLSHALGTPLNVIAGRAAMIGFGDLPAEEVVNNARIIERQVKQVTTLVQSVLDFVRRDVQPPLRVGLHEVAEQVLELFHLSAEKHAVKLLCGEIEQAEVLLVRDRLLGVLANIVSHGIFAAEPGQSLTLSARRRHAEPPLSERGRVKAGLYACFVVRYSNVRFKEQMLSRVYEPWFEKGVEERLLAAQLAVTFGVAREHRGWVEICNPDVGGAVVTVNWPVEAG